MRFGDLTYLEIRRLARAGCLAVLPTGCTEQQGPHLPVDFDTWFVERLCQAASERALRNFGVQSLVLPAIPFGPTPEHRNYGVGYVDIPSELHDDPDVPGGHADSFATSISLHLRRSAVRVNEIVDPAHLPVDWDDPDLDFARYSSNGVIGDPTHASAELGARLWEAVVDSVAATFHTIAASTVSPGDA